MKTGLKSFVRAISPFTKVKSSEGPPRAKTNVNEFFWDLSKVDMVAMLSNFYTTYNPERVRSVHEILHQYEGEEVLMLQQLCERYNLSESDIQTFLDNALLGRKDKDKFGNWIKKKGEGSVTFTDADSQAGGSTKASSVQETKDTRPRSGYSGFVWDLSTVDLPKALKLLYRMHNPQKTPNVASLDNKTENEKVLLLQQLCKRHNLTQAEMQLFLDKARSKDESSNGSTGSKARNGSRGKSPGTISATASDDGSQASKSGSIRKSVAGSDVAASLFSSFQRQGSRQSTAEKEEFMPERLQASASDQNVIVGGQQRQGSLPFWQNAFPLSAASSPPPPPPPPPSVFSSSPSPTGRPPAPGPASRQPQAEPPRSGSPTGSVAGSVTSSVTAGSRFGPADDGPLVGALNRANSRSNSKVSSSHASSLASLSRAGSVTSKRGGTAPILSSQHSAGIGSEYDDDARGADAIETPPEASYSEAQAAPVVSRSNSRAGSRAVVAAVDAASVAGARSAEGARASELLDLQRELSEARLQVVSAKKENLALAKALQNSKQRQTDAESTVSELSSHQAHLDQVPEMLAEISKLKSSLLQQEEREAALKRQYSQLKQQVQGLQDQVAAAERQCEDARGDVRDVLRLVDIMSASPAGIKTVLEAYLKQLGEATGSVPVKFGIGTDGRQIPISERVAMALQIKREQQALTKDKATPVDRARDQADSARSTPVKSRGAKGASSGGALERQQDNYQKFKSSVSEQREQRMSSDLVGRGRAGGEDGRGDEGGDRDEGEERIDARGGSEEFLDYASPVAAGRKSSSRGASRNRKSREDKAGEDGAVGNPDDVQAVAAPGTASDWIECLDPRSKRKYYYSAILKKSTWTKPAGYSSSGSSRVAPGTPGQLPALASMSVTMPSRYNSPSLSMHMTGRQTHGAVAAQRMTADELGASSTDGSGLQQSLPLRSSSLRSASPFGATAASPSPSPSVQIDYGNVFSTTSRTDLSAAQAPSRTSTYSSRSSSPAQSATTSAASAATAATVSSSAKGSAALRSGSPSVRTALQQSPARGGAEQDWVTAVDPNSNRKYWYNRKTKVSTWRQPAELII